MRAALTAALVVGLAVPAAAAGSLARLADAAAAALLAQAGGVRLELLPTTDRSGHARLALDLDELLRARLRAAPGLASEGERLQVVPILAEAPGRLILAARLVAQPSGRLHDVVAVSVETDPDLLALAARAPAALTGAVDVISSSRSAALPEPVLDLAFAGPERLLVLTPEALALYAVDGDALRLLHRHRFEARGDPVRHPGGLLRAVEQEAAVWVAASGRAGAVLFGIEGNALAQRQQADALPWPGSAGGLRFQPGTDLIAADIAGLGAGPFLHLDQGVAVDGNGRLLSAEAPGGELRVGSPVSRLWPHHVAASSPAPPGAADAVLVVSLAPPQPRVVAEVPVEGAVRALAARPAGRTTRLAAAVEVGGRGAVETRLLLFELAPQGPVE